MYLKSLQLIGFKSFAEKGTLEFLPGVTAVVGPNGCGKSNISDTIRCVLGEQSAKALRGSEMADVIFSGTDGRRAIGMAEVTMTFADVDPSLLSLPSINLDFSEVSITRRVRRRIGRRRFRDLIYTVRKNFGRIRTLPGGIGDVIMVFVLCRRIQC